MLTLALFNGSWQYPRIPGLDKFKGKLMHSAKWDSTYDLKGKTVAVVGGGSSAVQLVPSIQPSELHSHQPSPPLYMSDPIIKVVGKLIPFLRSPVWITTGFGAKFAGPGGTNFTVSLREDHNSVLNSAC
jgi:Flavin-binding monooxygenase-like